MIRGIVIQVENGSVRLFSADARAEGEFEEREFFQQYGVSSRPHRGCEILIDREGNLVFAVATNDRRYQLALQEGEVALHDDLGQKVHLTRAGIEAVSPQKITATAPLVETSSHLKVGSGYSGTFSTASGQVVTVQDGIIVSID